MIYKIMAIMGISLFSCGGPPPGVVVTREGDHYLVTVLNCGDAKWANPPIYRVAVGKSPPGGRIAEQCSLRILAEGSHGQNLKQWRYDSQPEGTTLERCAPLEPGLTYEVYIGASPKFGLGHFKVENNGDVTMIDGPCPR